MTFTKAVANGTIDIAADGEVSISQRRRLGPLPAGDRDRRSGRPRDELSSSTPAGTSRRSSTETPDGLEIALDKETYAPGEVARLKISPRFAGELLVTVGADKLLTTLTATVPEGGSTIDIPVGADWGAGAYVTATLYRPGDAQEIAHAGPRHRREMAEGRSGRRAAYGRARAARKDRRRARRFRSRFR